MECNHDSATVTLDREVYEQLAGLAAIGARESGQVGVGARLARHARRFNPHLARAHQQGVKAAQRARVERAAACKAFLREHSGRQLWLQVGSFWVPVTVRGRDPRFKDIIRFDCEITCGWLHPGRQGIEFDRFVLALPSSLVELPLSHCYPGAWTEPVRHQPEATADYGSLEDFQRYRDTVFVTPRQPVIR